MAALPASNHAACCPQDRFIEPIQQFDANSATGAYCACHVVRKLRGVYVDEFAERVRLRNRLTLLSQTVDVKLNRFPD